MSNWTTDPPEADQWYWIRDRWPDALHDVTLVRTLSLGGTIFYKVLASFDEGVLCELPVPSRAIAWKEYGGITRSVRPVTPPPFGEDDSNAD